jgi:hypothetical protein
MYKILQLELCIRRNNEYGINALSEMNRNENKSHLCKRCCKPAGSDILCQSCKNELLTNYEASSDWQTAIEIERATQTALRFRNDEDESEDKLYY